MDTLTAVTLMFVAATPAHVSELAENIAVDLHIPNDLQLKNALDSILEQLLSTGLIESTS